MSARRESAPGRPEPGTRLVFRWRKWDGSPHWLHECVYLGADDWGDWFGQLPGWRSSRPGRDFLVEAANVTLMPPHGMYALTVNVAPPAGYRIYIDLGWDIGWQDADGIPEPSGIDMDLDVVRAVDGRGIWIDDRDEWDEHRVAYGYPLDIVGRVAMPTTATAHNVAYLRTKRDLMGHAFGAGSDETGFGDPTTDLTTWVG